MERCAPWRGVAPSRTAATRTARGIRIIPLASAIVFTVAGCDALSDPQDSVPGSLVPQRVAIAVGQKQQIGAATRGNTPTWNSDDPRVVSVSTTGLASALAPGRAHVVLRLRGRADTTLVIVRAAVRAVHMVSSSTPLALGGVMGLSYSATDPAGDEIRDLRGTTIRWVSRNADIASVDSSGLIRAKTVGTTEIVLSIEGFTDSTLVRVTPEAPAGSPVEPMPPSPQPVKPPATPNPPAAAPATASVTVTLDSASLTTGHTSGAHAVAKDPKGNVLSGKTAIWSSLKPNVASVSTAGVITALSAGTASIQGSVDGVSGTASLTVTVPPVAPPPVVPPPAAPPPTSSPDLAEPTFDGTQSKMVFQQNFDTYTADSLVYPCGGVPPDNRIIDHSVFYCGGQTWTHDPNVTVGAGRSGKDVQWHYDGVYQETHGVQLRTVSNFSGTGKAPTVVQYWAKFTGDYATGPLSLTQKDGNGDPSAVVQIKNVMLWNDISRFQIMTHAHAGGCPLHGPSYTMLGQYDQGDSQCNADQPTGPFFGSYADGGWHRWTIYYKPNTGKGSRDGIARLWIDGVLAMRVEKAVCYDGASVLDASGKPIGIVPPGGWKNWCLTVDLDNLYSGNSGVGSLEWGANRTDGSGIPFIMAIDDVKWWVMK